MAFDFEMHPSQSRREAGKIEWAESDRDLSGESPEFRRDYDQTFKVTVYARERLPEMVDQQHAFLAMMNQVGRLSELRRNDGDHERADDVLISGLMGVLDGLAFSRDAD